MDFEHARKIAERLENNLKTLEKAVEFINETRDREGKFGDSQTFGVFSTIKQVLVAYVDCENDKEKLETYIKDLEEKANQIVKDFYWDKSTFFGTTLLDFINNKTRFYDSNYVVFSVEADRILKEIDAQVNTLCNEFSINKITGRVNTSDYLPSEQWDVEEVQKAFNIAKAVKSLADL